MLNINQIFQNQAAPGHPATGAKYGILSTSLSCSYITSGAFNKTSRAGGISHLMLPGNSPSKDKLEENTNAGNAIDNLLDSLKNIKQQKKQTSEFAKLARKWIKKKKLKQKLIT